MGEGAEHDEQEDRPDKRREQSTEAERARAYRDAGQPGQPAAQERAQDADPDVPQETHAFPGQHLAGREPGDRADDDPDEYPHGSV